MKGLRESIHRNSDYIRAGAIFGVTLIVFFAILNNRWAVDTIFDHFTNAVAWACAGIFTLAGQNASAMGQTVSVNGATLSIATGCNGIEALALYAAAVLALPTLWTRRLIGIGLGVVGIFIINQIRVVGLFLVAMLKPGWMSEAHQYAGQTFVIVMGMALWVFWAEHYAGFRAVKSRAAAA